MSSAPTSAENRADQPAGASAAQTKGARSKARVKAAPKPVASPLALEEDAHEWYSVRDSDRKQTWVFDVTFLSSGWNCIWGRGCQGIYNEPAEIKMEGCCSHGAHLSDGDDVRTVTTATRKLDATQWQHMRKAEKGGFLAKNRDGSVRTRVVDGACIFFNRPGFVGGPGCALHRGALDAGAKPLDWKPNVCWQLPLRRDDHTDQYGHVTSFVREWKRRDWGPGGDDFHWWCTEAPEAFDGKDPVWRTLQDEIIALVGQPAYDKVADYLQGRPTTTLLAHPAVKRQTGTTQPVALRRKGGM